jgi:hypothetical protein
MQFHGSRVRAKSLACRRCRKNKSFRRRDNNGGIVVQNSRLEGVVSARSERRRPPRAQKCLSLAHAAPTTDWRRCVRSNYFARATRGCITWANIEFACGWATLPKSRCAPATPCRWMERERECAQCKSKKGPCRFLQ